jgi:hypothetical protein
MDFYSWNEPPAALHGEAVRHAGGNRLITNTGGLGEAAPVDVGSILSRRMSRLRAWKENPHGEGTHYYPGGPVASAS